MDSYLKFNNTDLLHDQFTTFHLGVVKKVNDHEGRGRVRVEVPGLRGTGEENWTDWIDVIGSPVGGKTETPRVMLEFGGRYSQARPFVLGT